MARCNRRIRTRPGLRLFIRGEQRDSRMPIHVGYAGWGLSQSSRVSLVSAELKELSLSGNFVSARDASAWAG